MQHLRLHVESRNTVLDHTGQKRLSTVALYEAVWLIRGTDGIRGRGKLFHRWSKWWLLFFRTTNKSWNINVDSKVTLISCDLNTCVPDERQACVINPRVMTSRWFGGRQQIWLITRVLDVFNWTDCSRIPREPQTDSCQPLHRNKQYFPINQEKRQNDL